MDSYFNCGAVYFHFQILRGERRLVFDILDPFSYISDIYFNINIKTEPAKNII